MNKENWKDIKGFEGLYQVSNLGRIKSIGREVIYSNGRVVKYESKILKTNNKYQRPTTLLTKDKKTTTKNIHELVAQAFIGERPEGYHICHIDGDITNNELSNLRYDTVSENQIDIYRHGRKNGKLSLEQVLEVRKLYATGDYKQVELAEIFDVTQSQVSRIVLRASYSYLNDDGTIDDSQTAVS